MSASEGLRERTLYEVNQLALRATKDGKMVLLPESRILSSCGRGVSSLQTHLVEPLPLYNNNNYEEGEQPLLPLLVSTVPGSSYP